LNSSGKGRLGSTLEVDDDDDDDNYCELFTPTNFMVFRITSSNPLKDVISAPYTQLGGEFSWPNLRRSGYCSQSVNQFIIQLVNQPSHSARTSMYAQTRK